MNNLLNSMAVDVKPACLSLAIGEKVVEFFGDFNEGLLDEIGILTSHPSKTIEEAVFFYKNSDKSDVKTSSISHRLKELYLEAIYKCGDINSLKMINIDNIPEFLPRKIATSIRRAYFEKFDCIIISLCEKTETKADLRNLINECSDTIHYSKESQGLISTKINLFIMDDINKAKTAVAVRNIFNEILNEKSISFVSSFIQDILIRKMESFESTRFRNEYFQENASFKNVYSKYKTARRMEFDKFRIIIEEKLFDSQLFDDEFKDYNAQMFEAAFHQYDDYRIRSKIIDKWLSVTENYMDVERIYRTITDTINVDAAESIVYKWIELCGSQITAAETLEDLVEFFDPIFEVARREKISELIDSIYNTFFENIIAKINKSESAEALSDFICYWEYQPIQHAALRRIISINKDIKDTIDIFHGMPADFLSSAEFKKAWLEIESICVNEINKCGNPDEIKDIYWATKSFDSQKIGRAAFLNVLKIFTEQDS